MNFENFSVQEVAKQLHTDIKKGLSQEEVARRQAEYGLNIVEGPKQESWFLVFLRQFKNPLIYILLAAATIIFFIGQNPLDAFIISGVLFFNAIVGTIQEGRTRSILHSLERFIVANSIVLRNGKKQLIENKYLVPGDIIVLQEGQRVPADARIAESNNMQVDEAMLTGESLPVHKSEEVLSPETQLGEKVNMVFKGTYILAGSGIAIVTATGAETEVGKLQKAVQEIQTDMPLKQELNQLSYWVLIFILIMCALLLVIGIAQGKPLQELFVMLTALFICVVPEGLPVVLTLILVSGVYRMAKHNVLVKNMQAVEGLGRTDVIVIDKTGTLTRNEMIVSRVALVDGIVFHVSGQGYRAGGVVTRDNQKLTEDTLSSPLRDIGIACSLLNTAEITYFPESNLFDIKGDPTEAALFVLSQKLGLSRTELEKQYHKIYEIPFSSEYKYHAGFYEHQGQGIAYSIGSPEVLISNAENKASQKIEIVLDQLLQDGLRVVAIAHKTFKLPSNEQDLQFYKNIVSSGITILGFCGLEDTVRDEVSEIIKQARSAGLRVIMATGDHQATALMVAKRVGIFRQGDVSVNGSEFEVMSDAELLAQLPDITIFSRVSPQHKLRIIQLFHQKGQIVAMTGDGTNDAPSLVAADLGIAMGRIGTEVAKHASDLILLDDSFENIINAIKQGRHIFYTLKRVILYFFATNMGEILIILFALILNLPLPILAAQILWLNLVTDGFLDIALSTEPQEEGLLHKRWLHKKAHLVDTSLLLKMMWMAIPMGVVSVAVFAYYQQFDIVLARTMTLITMAMFQWFNAWNCRSDTKSLFQSGLFTNKWLIAATLLVLALQIVVTEVPFMQRIFQTVPISLEQWIFIFIISSSIVFLEEGRKLIVRRWYMN